MSSLKSYIPTLAHIARLTPAALYERQRALVRAGLLAADPGRGPGSGVKATPQSVAMLLLSVLSADNLSDVGERTAAIAACKCRGRVACPVSRATTLAEALKWALESEKNANTLVSVFVSHDWPHATLVYESGTRKKFVDFGEPPPTNFMPISVQANFTAASVMKKIAADLKRAAKEEEKQ